MRSAENVGRTVGDSSAMAHWVLALAVPLAPAYVALAVWLIVKGLNVASRSETA